MKAVLGVARAPFLLLPVALVAAGTGVAAWDGGADLLRAALALLGLIGMHVAVNALNEWSDFRSGIDLETERTPFSGGSGTLPAGRLAPGGALIVAGAGALIGLGVGVLFLAEVGRPLLPVLIVGAIGVFAYTDLLARMGVGEVFAGLGLGCLPVVGTALVQTGLVTEAALAASVPAFCMTFNLLLLNEFPDERADRRGGRRNLVILLGRRSAAWLYVLVALLVPACLAVAVIIRALPPLALLGAAPTLLLVPVIRWACSEPDRPVPPPGLGANVAWNLLTNLLLGAGLLLA